GGAGPGELRVEAPLRRRPAAATAVLARPEEADVAAGVEPPLPVAQEAELLRERRLVVRDALGTRRPVGGEPGAYLVPEPVVGGRVGEVHRRPPVYQDSNPARKDGRSLWRQAFPRRAER